MAGQTIAANTPIQVNLEKGKTYFFCMCGRSATQPFCDGSHAGTDFKPRQFVVDTAQQAYLCRCKHTGNPPYCDGTHKRFTDDQVGKEGPGTVAGS